MLWQLISPPTFMLSCHSCFLKDGTRVRLLTWYLEDLFLQFLDQFLQSSTPSEILGESGDSGLHLPGGEFISTQQK